MKRGYIVFLTTIGILFLALWYTRSKEGFAQEKEPSEHPLALAQKMIQQVMVPVRKVAKYALDTDMIMERFQQRNKSPMELAREYMKKQQ